MKKQMILVGALTMLVVALTSRPASAQMMPNMDMSWAMQSQMRLQQRGDAVAANTARAYYLYMQNLRRRGYRGPSLPTGVTNESLRRSIEGAQNSANALIQSGMVNSNRRSNAVGNWDLRALRGCQQVVNVYGHTTLVCPY